VSELTNLYWELGRHGHQIDVARCDGGALEGESWSDPRGQSGDSADDLISLGFISWPEHSKLVRESTTLAATADRRGARTLIAPMPAARDAP
jgi:hypothetical protein